MPVLLITTGGSIDKTYSTASSDFVVAEPAATGILKEAGAEPDVRVLPLMRKDSLEITDGDREEIVAAVADSGFDRIIITHGTDTMTLTARALQGIAGKVIVLTGAMKPAAFRDSDAPFNLGGALIAVRHLPPGVYIVFNGQTFPADRVRKDTRKDRFEQTLP